MQALALIGGVVVASFIAIGVYTYFTNRTTTTRRKK